MAKNNRKCICCGTEYYYCPTCGGSRKEPWRNNYCCENCRDIFMAVTDYLAGVITADQAIQKLSVCDLSKKDQFTDVIKDVINSLVNTKNDSNIDSEKGDGIVVNGNEGQEDSQDGNKVSKKKKSKAKEVKQDDVSESENADISWYV